MRAVQGRLDRIARAIGEAPDCPVIARFCAEAEASARLRHPAPGYGGSERASDTALIARSAWGWTGFEAGWAGALPPWPASPQVAGIIDCDGDDTETAALLASLRPAEPAPPPDAPAPVEPPPAEPPPNKARAEREEREARKTRKLRINIYHQ